MAAEHKFMGFEPQDRLMAAKAFVAGTRLLTYGQYEQIRSMMPRDLDERQAALDADRQVYEAFMQKLERQQAEYRAQTKAAKSPKSMVFESLEGHSERELNSRPLCNRKAARYQVYLMQGHEVSRVEYSSKSHVVSVRAKDTAKSLCGMGGAFASASLEWADNRPATEDSLCNTCKYEANRRGLTVYDR